MKRARRALALVLLLVLSSCRRDTLPPVSDRAGEWIRAGNEALARGAYDRALSLADSLDAEGPGSPDAQLLRGRAEFELGDLDAAERSFRSVVEQAPGYPGALLNLGNVHFARREFRMALPLYQASARQSRDPRSWHAVAGTYERLAVADSAEAAARRAVSLDSLYGPAWRTLSDLALGEGRLDEALACARTAYRLDPEAPGAALHRARLENLQGSSAEAVRLLEPLVRSEPWNYTVVYELARAHRRMGDEGTATALLGRSDALREALQETELLERRVEAAPDDFGLRVELGDRYRGQGRRDEAVVQYQAALRLRPDNLELRANLATVLLASGRTDEALSHFEHVLRRDDRHFPSLVNLAVHFARSGDRRRAGVFVERARSIRPDHPVLAQLDSLLAE